MANPALRLTFEYEGSTIRLVSAQSLDMVALPSDHLRKLSDLAGFWYELQGTKGETVYRRVIHNPLQTGVEGPVGEHGPELAWETASQPLKGTFIVLVPDLPEARHIVVFSSPPGPEQTGQPAREIARFPLKQEPTGEERPQ
jgi:hypothetical protein